MPPSSHTPAPQADAPVTDTLAWFDEARFGLFVHFGLYAIPARHEWVMTREKHSPEDYERYADLFDPDRFDARQIARTADHEAPRGLLPLRQRADGLHLPARLRARPRARVRGRPA